MSAAYSKKSSKQLQAYQQAQQTRTGEERDEEIMRHLPLVHKIVERIAVHLPSSIDKDDLFHAGVIGLIDAIDRFDASRNNAFSTYAVLRIRGSIMDELRARDCVSRNMRQQTRQYHQAIHDLTNALGRIPDDEELAQHLDISQEHLFEIERHSQLCHQVSLDAPVGEQGPLGNILGEVNEQDHPGAALEEADQVRVLHDIVDHLKEQERLIIKLYYFEGLLMKEIAMILDITESRVCQIHSRLMAMLRMRLQHAGVDQ